MNKVTFDYSKAKAFISDHEMVSMKKIAEQAKAELLGKEGAGNLSYLKGKAASFPCPGRFEKAGAYSRLGEKAFGYFKGKDEKSGFYPGN